MTHTIVGIDPTTPLLERQSAFLDLVRRVRAEADESDVVQHHGGHRLRVSSSLAERLGLDGKTANPNARGVEPDDRGPASPHVLAAAEIERKRGVELTQPDAATATNERTARSTTASKRAAKRTTKASKSARKSQPRKTAAKRAAKSTKSAAARKRGGTTR